MSTLTLWAKTWRSPSPPPPESPTWHPLVYHSLDVAACCEAILHVRRGALERVARLLHVDPDALAPVVVALAALHDIGKCAAGFQGKRPDLWPPILGPMPAETVPTRHDAAGVWLFREVEGLEDIVIKLLPGLSGSTRATIVQAVCAHHGEPCNVRHGDPGNVIADPAKEIGAAAQAVAVDLARELVAVVGAEPVRVPDRHGRLLSWWMSGLMVFADWLGSSHEWFPFEAGIPLTDYWRFARRRAERAVAEAGVIPAAVTPTLSLGDLIPGGTPSPVQAWAEGLKIHGPALVVIEDATGSGKTEAALLLAHRLMQANRYSALHIALPTMATVNAMHTRLAGLYRTIYRGSPSEPSLTLAHGRASRRDDEGDAWCNWWLRSNKKAFLAQAGAATIDQCLLSILPVRHQSLRMWGLLDSVLIVDEAHAYDAYMSRELETLIEFQAALGGSAVILSATLPQETRRQLVAAWRRGRGTLAAWAPAHAEYPLATVIDDGGVTETPLDLRTGLARTVPLRRVETLDEVHAAAVAAARAGGAVCVIRNTVREAQETWRRLEADCPEVLLFHSRFTAGDRARIEAEVLRRWGKSGRSRPGILVATQVVEQSLDLDFDFMATDLAPIDLLIQRVGRWRRHPRGARPVVTDDVLVLSPQATTAANARWPSDVLPFTAYVYPDRGWLWRTARLVDERCAIVTTDVRDIVEAVYGGTEVAPALGSDATRTADTRDGDRARGEQATLSLRAGYAPGDVWELDERARTRLGEMSVTLRLGTVAQGKLEPLGDSWEDAEVPVARYPFSQPINAPADEARVAEVRRSWAPGERETPVLVLDRLGRGHALNGRRENVTVNYGPALGLAIQRE